MATSARYGYHYETAFQPVHRALPYNFAVLKPDSSVDKVPSLSADARPEVDRLLSAVVQLTGSSIRIDSVADMFQSSFRQMMEVVLFDVAVGVVLEQTLDLYVSRRQGLTGYNDSILIEKIRQVLQSQIAATFKSTDAMIRTEDTLLPSGGDGDPFRFQAQTILRPQRRTAGVIVLFRGEADFQPYEQQVLEILSNQLAISLERIRIEVKMQNLADTDDLTGIWNRRYFRRHLPSEMERARIYGFPLSLLLVDLDDFKLVNDGFGHPMGDVLLSEVCGTIRESLRPPDLFARFGGDEFVVILPHTDQEGAQTVADRIVKRIRGLEITSDQGNVRASVSIGMATMGEQDGTPTELIDRADQALYRAKRSGKGRYEL